MDSSFPACSSFHGTLPPRITSFHLILLCATDFLESICLVYRRRGFGEDVVAHESRVTFDSRVRAISESYLNRGASSQDTSEPLLTILSIEERIENLSQDPSEPLLRSYLLRIVLRNFSQDPSEPLLRSYLLRNVLSRRPVKS